MTEVFIDGTPFAAVFHRDGRFFRAPGLFAFARCDADGRYTVLHLELTEAINRRADSSHPRWGWALSEGMNALLVHRAGAAASVDGASDERRNARWHPDAQVRMGETEPEEDAWPSASADAPGRRASPGR
jgi:hypothetical protein